MGIWNYYFIVKLALFFGGYIGFHRWENLSFAALLLIPVRRPPLRALRLAFALPASIVLLYHDSWLPPLARVRDSMSAISGFSGEYLIELLGRFVNLQLVGTLLGLCLVIAALGRRLRISTFVILAMLLSPQLEPLPHLIVAALAPKASDCSPCRGNDQLATKGEETESQAEVNADPDSLLQMFYADEEKRRVLLPNDVRHPKAFDILIVHVCSLAWDDIRFVKDQHPLFEHFDILFTNFNSAATYSGPAAIRLLRASCGQQPQSALYQDTAPQCYLLNSLQGAGYTANVLLNHDGLYESFLANLGRYGGVNVASQGNLGARTSMKAFYGSPIYDDYDILSRWWQRRLSSTDGPVALYYNTISLHDGNKVPGKEAISSLDTYKPRMDQLFADLDRFLVDVREAGRPVVVLFVPEHGAALRGDKVQIAGMREIPSPLITLVPVGIKFIGFPEGLVPASQLVVDREVSFLALTALLEHLLRYDPSSPSATELANIVKGLPKTRFVAENDATVMLKSGPTYWMRTPDLKWSEYQVAR